MKKALSILLVLAMVAAFIPTFAVSVAADPIDPGEPETVPGLTMTSYGMYAVTNGWNDSIIRFIGDTNGASYRANYDGSQKFDQSIDEILAWSAKYTAEEPVANFGSFNAGYVNDKYKVGNGGNNYEDADFEVVDDDK